MHRPLFFSLVLCVALLVTVAGASARSATCSDYATQAAAQRAADTADPDGDGVFCESLPCPCSAAAGGGSGDTGASPPCVRPKRVVRLRFSAGKYRQIRRHFRAAVKRGWPKILVVNRRGSDARRERLLAGIPTRDGLDRDEYPPAVGRGKGKGLTRGRDPRGWKADVRYVPSGENRSHGSSLGAKLSRYCDGTRFRYVFK